MPTRVLIALALLCGVLIVFAFTIQWSSPAGKSAATPGGRLAVVAEQFDLVVVGGGPAGYAAALYGAGAGLNIAVVEKDKVGGTCLHRGCIPAKEYLETASVYRTVSHAKDFGVVSDQPTVEFATSQARKQKVVDQLWKGLQGLMKQRKITTFIGTGRLDADGIVRVSGGEADGIELHGTNVLLCAGSVPRTLPGFDVDGKYVMTSDEVLMLDKLPTSAVVVGGGAIGCEFAVVAGRPRRAGNGPRVPSRRSSPDATRTRPTWWPAASRSGASTSAPASKSKATRRPATARKPRSASARTRPSPPT